MTWRRNEWMTFGSFMALAGLIWAFSAKSSVLDSVAKVVTDERTGIVAHETRIQLLEKQSKDEMVILNSIANAVGAKRHSKDDD